MKKSIVMACLLLAMGEVEANKCYWVPDSAGGEGGWADSTRWRDMYDINRPNPILTEGNPIAPKSGDDIYLFGDVTITDDDIETAKLAGWITLSQTNTVCHIAVTGSHAISSTLSQNAEGGGRKFEIVSGAITLYKFYRNAIVSVVGGSLTLGTDNNYFKFPGVVNVVAPNVCYIPQGAYYVAGITGDGTITSAEGSTDSQLYIVGSLTGEPHIFTGTLSGKVAPSMWGGWGAGEQYITKADNGNTGDFRFVKGTLGVSSFGGATGTASSWGTSKVWIGVGGDGSTMRLRYLGDTAATTTRDFFFNGNPLNEVALDGGAYGGLTISGSFDMSTKVTDNILFALEGSNTETCVFGPDWKKEPSVGSTHFVKRGSGTWRFPHTNNSRYTGVFAVEKGTLEYATMADKGALSSLGYATRLYARYAGAVDESRVVPWAYLLGNGADDAAAEGLATFSYVGTQDVVFPARPIALKGAARVRNDTAYIFAWSNVTAAVAGNHTLVLDAAAGLNALRSVTNGVGNVALVKEGAGTWTIGGDVDVSGDVVVKAGELAVDPYYTWFRLVVKKLYGSNSASIISHIAFFAEDGSEQSLNLAYDKNANSDKAQLDAGETCFGGGGYSINGSRLPSHAFIPYDGNSMVALSLGKAIALEDETTWPKIVCRLPAGCKKVTKYDFITGWHDNTAAVPEGRTPTDWVLEGSVDGAVWEELDSHSNYTTARKGDNYWISDASSPKTANPTGFTIATKESDTKYVKTKQLNSLSVAAGATFRAGGITVNKIVLDAAGGGTIDGVTLPQTGTIALCNAPSDCSASFTAPITWRNTQGVENLNDWSLEIDGKISLSYGLLPVSGGIRFVAHGTTIFVR